MINVKHKIYCKILELRESSDKSIGNAADFNIRCFQHYLIWGMVDSHEETRSLIIWHTINLSKL